MGRQRKRIDGAEQVDRWNRSMEGERASASMGGAVRWGERFNRESGASTERTGRRREWVSGGSGLAGSASRPTERVDGEGSLMDGADRRGEWVNGCGNNGEPARGG